MINRQLRYSVANYQYDKHTDRFGTEGHRGDKTIKYETDRSSGKNISSIPPVSALLIRSFILFLITFCHIRVF